MDISQITDFLYVGAQPEDAHCPALCDLGIQLVISMRAERRPGRAFHQAPLRSLWLRTFDSVLTPIPLRALVQGVDAALPVIDSGGRVLVHCQRGRHRSVAMAAAILIALGSSAQEAMALLRARRAAADPQIWYVRRRIELFERYWQGRGGAPRALPAARP